ncbi:unnamed protein product [Schistosoma curassoni]|uniref:Rit1_C domain-containing protein n=1 Tax=Schistosoma curassoni TaxID=6186 RepID=A0A183K7H9_9TREM|nr:unnamed protein product [Schistosoma curassoni]
MLNKEILRFHITVINVSIGSVLHFIVAQFKEFNANKPIWSSMKSNSLQDLNQSIWNIVFIQLDQQITNQSESTLSDYKNKIQFEFRECMNQKQQGTGYEGVFCSCELAKHHRTGGLATLCANDPLWHSSILPSDRPKNTPFLDWQLAYVSLNSSDTEQKDYKLIPYTSFILNREHSICDLKFIKYTNVANSNEPLWKIDGSTLTNKLEWHNIHIPINTNLQSSDFKSLLNHILRMFYPHRACRSQTQDVQALSVCSSDVLWRSNLSKVHISKDKWNQVYVKLDTSPTVNNQISTNLADFKFEHRSCICSVFAVETKRSSLLVEYIDENVFYPTTFQLPDAFSFFVSNLT